MSSRAAPESEAIMQKIRLEEPPARPPGKLRRMLNPSARHQTGPEPATAPVIQLPEGRAPAQPTSSLERALAARIDAGLRQVERTAARLMNDIASEVWRTVGPEAAATQEQQALAVLARDQALKSTIAHSDERFQAIDVRIGRIEQGLRALSGAVQSLPQRVREDIVAARTALARDVTAAAAAADTRLAGSAARVAATADRLEAGMRSLAAGQSARDEVALKQVDRMGHAIGGRAAETLARVERTATEVTKQLQATVAGLDARFADLDRSLAKRIERGDAATAERLTASLESVARRAEASVEATGSRADAAFSRALRRLDAAMATAARRTNALLADGVQRLEASRNETAEQVGAVVEAMHSRSEESVREALERTARIEMQISTLAARAKELPTADRVDTALALMAERIGDLDRAMTGLAGREMPDDRGPAARLEAATTTFVDRFEALAEALATSVAENAEGLARVERRLANERAEAEQEQQDHRDDALSALRRDLRRQQFGMRDALLEVVRRMDAQTEDLKERMAGMASALEGVRREAARRATPVAHSNPTARPATPTARPSAPTVRSSTPTARQVLSASRQAPPTPRTPAERERTPRIRRSERLSGVDAGFFGGPGPD